MKAVLAPTYGNPDVLQLGEIEQPTPGPGQLLVRVRAAAVDPGVWHMLTGRPQLIRLMGYGLRTPKNPVLGTNFAGEVAALGPGVTGYAPGDAVFGTGSAAFAEYALAKPEQLAHQPERLTVDQAAALPTAGYTAWQGLHTAGKLQSGQRALVIGAGGGVGTLAVQLAKALGAHVTGVCGADKVDLVRSLGADDVIDYTSGEITDRGRHDLILDCAGQRPVGALREALTPKGTISFIGGEGGSRLLGGMTRTMRAAMLAPVYGQRMQWVYAKPVEEDLRILTGYAADGSLTPVVGATFPLERAADAVRLLEQGHARGRIVLTL